MPVEVFYGNKLLQKPPESVLNIENPLCYLYGINDKRIPLQEKLFSSHILFLGGIGTGKTNAIFQLVLQLRQKLDYDDVMIIFDTKGDFYQEFYTQGDIVIANDEKATGENGKDYWNIFKELGDDERKVEENIIEISKTLFHEKIARAPQPFFPTAAKDLFAAIMLDIVRSNDFSKSNNKYLTDFIKGATVEDLQEMLRNHNDLRAMVSYIADVRSPQSMGVVSELQQMVNEIFIGNFSKEGNISIRNIIKNKGGKVIFIEYDLAVGNLLSPIYRLLLDLALKEALSRNRSEGNVWFIIDEFRLIPNLQHVDDGINFGRSLGVKFIIGVQNIEQLFSSYGESLARSILSGFMTTVAFRVVDPTTRNYIKDLFGKNRKIERFQARVPGGGWVETAYEANVVEDHDILNLPVGKAIIGFPGEQPFLFQFEKYELVKEKLLW